MTEVSCQHIIAALRTFIRERISLRQSTRQRPNRNVQTKAEFTDNSYKSKMISKAEIITIRH